MAAYAYFYNSDNGDRVYDADDFSAWLKPFFLTGVFDGELEVTANGGMTVSVAKGYCNIDGKVRLFDDATSLTLSTAHSTLNRIDNIVARRNDTDRDITLAVVQGTNANTPVAPEPVREDGVYDLVIAQVYVSAAAVQITQANITDTRSDEELCGIVRTPVGDYYTKAEIDAMLTDGDSISY